MNDEPARVADTEPDAAPGDAERRSVRDSLSNLAMGAGLLAAYGGLGAIAARYLFPAQDAPKQWLFVATVVEMKTGESRPFVTPAGSRVTIARVAERGDVSDFIALSSTCPHLGCQVHWEGQNNRFFCPCHNGQFDPSGKATAGPPAAAGQSLLRFPLKIEGGLLYLESPIEKLAAIETIESRGGPGHDPCLAQRPRATRREA